jgi:folate-binding protein YgfZ
MTAVETECAVARKDCVLFEHPNRGVIEVSGTDRISFLHNILSNDIKSLSLGKGIFACLLNAQAKIIAQVNVLCFDEFIWLTFDYQLRDKFFEAINKLIIMEEVGLKDKSDELKLISIHGPKAKEVIKSIFPPNEMLAHQKIIISEASGILIRINLIGEIGYGLLVNQKEANIFKGLFEKTGITQIHAETFETLRIEAGIPRYGIDYDESNIPLEVRLDHTISFTKGCFPGQEILARLNSRGGLSKKLMGLTLEGKIVPKKNSRILKDGYEIGSVTSAAFSPTLKKVMAMGFLKKEFWNPGTSLVVEGEGNQIPALYPFEL